MNTKNFSKNVEGLVNPISVGTLHFMQSFNELLPKSIQKLFIASSSKKTPYMGFVVEPYSFFLCYEIADVEKAKALLPDGFDLVTTKIFSDDEPKYYCILSSFRSHTSAFWGARSEFYIIAEDKKTGLLSWIIVDYDTNTIRYDSKNGLRGPNSSKSIMTINHRGRLFVDVERDDKSRKLVLDADVEKGEMTKLDQRLWLEGNLSIGYGRVLSENEADIFSLKFEPLEVEKALRIPEKSLNLESNTWYPGLFKAIPSQIVCFPYAQHFVSDSPGHASNIQNKEQLEAAVESLDFSKIDVFSTKQFKTMIMLGSFVSFVVIAVLIILLLIK